MAKRTVRRELPPGYITQPNIHSLEAAPINDNEQIFCDDAVVIELGDGRWIVTDRDKLLRLGLVRNPDEPTNLAQLAEWVRRNTRKHRLADLLEYLHEHGSATYQQLRDEVYKYPADDSTIKRRITEAIRLIEGKEIPAELPTRHEHGTWTVYLKYV
jgi:hypothetical protein